MYTYSYIPHLNSIYINVHRCILMHTYFPFMCVHAHTHRKGERKRKCFTFIFLLVFSGIISLSSNFSPNVFFWGNIPISTTN